MHDFCPVCFNATSADYCPHCGTDLRILRKVFAQENADSKRQADLLEALEHYRRLNHPQAVSRVLGMLAEFCLQTGRWREARHHLEATIALGEQASTPRFYQRTRRQLAGLLGRIGEIPLALHILGELENSADEDEKQLAVVERLRLEIDTYSKINTLKIVQQMERRSNATRIEQVWRLEAITRFGSLLNDQKVLSTIAESEAAGDANCEAIARRCLGIWHSNKGAFTEATEQLTRAIELFKKAQEPYETARTQVDLARTHLLKEVGSTSPARSEIAIATAQTLLQSATAAFRKLGTTAADASASELMQSLAIGRQVEALRRDATSTSTAIIWVELTGSWSELTYAQTADIVHRHGGLTERLLGGLVVLFGEVQHGGDLNVIVETSLALYDLLMHHQSRFKASPNTGFSITCSVGMLPLDSKDPVRALRILPQLALFKDTRARAVQLRTGTVCVNDMLFMTAQERYAFLPMETPDHITQGSESSQDSAARHEGAEPGKPDAAPPATETTPATPETAPADDDIEPRVTWWQLMIPQHRAMKVKTPSRYQHVGYEDVFRQIDTVFAGLKQTGGGMIALTGAPGTGKTRLLDTLIQEMQSSTGAWSIHLRGRKAMRHQPFGAIKDWLGSDLPYSGQMPSERRLTHIASFRRSLMGLLTSKPLLLVVDDLHLLDSASLATLEAVMPLMKTHRLIVILAAREKPVDEESETDWNRLLELAVRAIPEHTVQVHLPEEKAYKPREFPAGMSERHVLACAAVLGDRFSTIELRFMSGIPDLENRLTNLKSAGWVEPTEKWQIWQFISTAERDTIYERLAPDYRAMLHWYARQALKILGLPNDHHIHPAGLPEPAIKVSMRAAQHALELDSPIEATIFFDRALRHYEGEGIPVDLLLSKAAMRLNLEDWSGAMQVLSIIEALPDLSPRDQATLLIYQGELNFRVGEIAMLFRLYEQAAARLRELPPEETDPTEQISIMYAQALARFKRGEMEMARSLTGGALLIAQQAGLDNELAHLWELLAKIHYERGESTQAQSALEKAMDIHRKGNYHWQILEPLHFSGKLMMDAGKLDDARKFLNDSLALAQEIGAVESIVQLHYELGQVAMYRGEFSVMQTHLEAALNVVVFAKNLLDVVKIYAASIEGLMMQDRLIDAMQQASRALEIATADSDGTGRAYAHLALARTAMHLNRLDEAAAALERSKAQTIFSEDPYLRLMQGYTAMDIALRQENTDAYQSALESTRGIATTRAHSEQFIRAQIGLLVAQHEATINDWNESARLIENASRTFESIGATHWRGLARERLDTIAPRVTDSLLNKPRTVNLRSAKSSKK